MAAREVVICTPVRTAIGTYGGNLKATPATALGATGTKAVIDRSGLDPAKVETVVMGDVIPAGARMNPARQAAINGGVPVEAPAMTVNRVCGSGAQGVATAAQEVWLGLIDSAISGGIENMDMAPYLAPDGRWGHRLGHGQLLDAVLTDRLNDALSDRHSSWHTQDLVEKYRITRDDQDRFAERSQRSFSAAQAAGKFHAEIAPVEVKGRK